MGPFKGPRKSAKIKKNLKNQKKKTEIRPGADQSNFQGGGHNFPTGPPDPRLNMSCFQIYTINKKYLQLKVI